MDGSGVAEVAALTGAVDGLLDLDLSRLSPAELTEVLVDVEAQKRRLAALDVALLVELRERRIAREHCRASLEELLVTELRVSPREAKQRVLASSMLGSRVSLAGETLQPMLARTAAAVVAGEISAEHVQVIENTLERLPASVAVEAHGVWERLLVDARRGGGSARVAHDGAVVAGPGGSRRARAAGARRDVAGVAVDPGGVGVVDGAGPVDPGGDGGVGGGARLPRRTAAGRGRCAGPTHARAAAPRRAV